MSHKLPIVHALNAHAAPGFCLIRAACLSPWQLLACPRFQLCAQARLQGEKHVGCGAQVGPQPALMYSSHCLFALIHLAFSCVVLVAVFLQPQAATEAMRACPRYQLLPCQGRAVGGGRPLRSAWREHLPWDCRWVALGSCCSRNRVLAPSCCTQPHEWVPDAGRVQHRSVAVTVNRQPLTGRSTVCAAACLPTCRWRNTVQPWQRWVVLL